MSSYRIMGTLAVFALGTAAFWNDHQDAVVVFFGFSILILISIFLVARLDAKNLRFQEEQVKMLRSHIARFYTTQRRKNKSFERRIVELEEVTRTVDAIESNCQARSQKNDSLRSSIAVLKENQLSIRDHFHARVGVIEYKLTLAHDKAVARLALKGAYDNDKDEK